MKTAVLTTHRANNYGAVLQAYALTFKVNQLGEDCELLDYRCPSFELVYHSCRSIYRGKNPLILMRHSVLRILRRFCRDRRAVDSFALFRKKYLKISSETYKTLPQLASAESDYDLFIAGSDQIWNPLITTGNVENFDRTYLLNFVKDKQKKHSYAASIGVSAVSERLADIYRKYLADFSTVSVREHKGAEILQALLKKEILTVCDPVLLLESSEWQQVEKSVKLRSQDYILVYCVAGGQKLERYADKLAAEMGCAVYYIQPPVVVSVASKKKNVLTGVGPSEFVWLIRNAQAVVTTSFHASAFSLLFGIPLHCHMDNPNSSSQRNSRLDSLFSFFGVDERQIVRSGAGDSPIVTITPNDENQRALSESREASLNVLRKIFHPELNVGTCMHR